jgi:hypothetical protein
MSVSSGPRGISSGLIFSTDPANVKSYKGSGSLLQNAAGAGSLTLTNGPTFSTDKIGSIMIDGTDDYAEVTNSVSTAALSPSVATFSIWVSPDGTGMAAKTCSLISRGNYNTSGGFFIHMPYGIIVNNSPVVQANFSYSSTTSYSFDGTLNYPLPGKFNGWSNVTVAVDSTISLYINGELKENKSRSNSASTIIYGAGSIGTGGDTNLTLCSTLSYVPAYTDSNWQPYKGKFAAFQMWNRRLTQSEIKQNYDTLKSRFGV